MLGLFSFLALTLNQIPLQLALIAIVLGLLLIAGYKDFLKLAVSLAPFIVFMNLAFLLFLASYRANIFEAILLIDLRILLIFLTFAFFAFTTDLIAVVKLMKKMRFPEVVYLPFYVVLRFLPELERDFQEVRQVQKLKGVSIRQPGKYFKSLFLPLTYVVFERADELSIAYYLRQNRARVK
jgi:energy-coupling factor transport system permease protein